mmetsp:Transcript_10524/g.36355  ORF Transcript_10524/g.36355 Transcript_10524/m.36355 type:complete len:330 (-) Transcript_10524:121-1110(-)
MHVGHRFADSLVPHQPRRARAHGSKVAKSHLRLVLDQEVRHHRRKYRVDQIFLVLLLLHQGTLPGLRERCDDLLVHESGPLGGLDEVPHNDDGQHHDAEVDEGAEEHVPADFDALVPANVDIAVQLPMPQKISVQGQVIRHVLRDFIHDLVHELVHGLVCDAVPQDAVPVHGFRLEEHPGVTHLGGVHERDDDEKTQRGEAHDLEGRHEGKTHEDERYQRHRIKVDLENEHVGRTQQHPVADVDRVRVAARHEGHEGDVCGARDVQNASLGLEPPGAVDEEARHEAGGHHDESDAIQCSADLRQTVRCQQLHIAILRAGLLADLAEAFR